MNICSYENPLGKSDLVSPGQKLEPRIQNLILNLQIRNNETFVMKLSEIGVPILRAVTSNRFGKSAMILDADGNKIELWEPITSA